jgi:hypothetical protein
MMLRLLQHVKMLVLVVVELLLFGKIMPEVSNHGDVVVADNLEWVLTCVPGLFVSEGGNILPVTLESRERPFVATDDELASIIIKTHREVYTNLMTTCAHGVPLFKVELIL